MIFGQTFSWVLTQIYDAARTFGPLDWVGAYGIAIIALTVGIKSLLSPIYQLQLRMSKRTMAQQRMLAPQMAEIKKKHKGDPQKRQQAQMELYKEHGISPFSQLSGCLPSVLQMPILLALYWVFLENAKSHRFTADNFLFIPHLNDSPRSHALIAGAPIPSIAYLIIPLLAMATTFVQSRMMAQPPNPNATEQEQQSQQMTRQMSVMMPLFIGYFAIVTPAGLGLYWTVSNLFAIIQQYLVNGWGGLFPKRQQPRVEPPPQAPLPAKNPRRPRNPKT